MLAPELIDIVEIRRGVDPTQLLSGRRLAGCELDAGDRLLLEKIHNRGQAARMLGVFPGNIQV